ncbi:2-polyprenyl-3-methyl-5-hydroxy-6-metoxy-1,4-benzoquinol methylase [Clostridium acetobutylicum]|uniref:S-adenosylmethionine-dependent methyltransferase n=1 Tax=Clostridium acetobutylicum (strain ATCC 824 / DSM 792 / JCM 1419 / IAM 19013 / LMG 5710 / NBRC 13948 / NRRL B-527 / VKM B-1787 / 2291 / W) TaxID=272562 RepID=Q97D23_CLOAB|nr:MULTISPECIES: class I SAM-dependent methyltransferase [Clostridium]AAK81581.1 S-adenosylmethionine-dependent methyltransferase [Clostridium acetobutylicum ATCC 824]ADZ22703.1 S-adenosylmethionine-dependent methyltransferase [Clostridium acetobutylicum EA 2018]AEI32976.1 S-adenosylmethionine-dependent methyltransferase [Clostridium acetobutylicum DSM 1731]AWV80745.1 SAM-dependent methyltransferase [Clostridium acetobutylicum]KHD35470.1 SAM-dependent methyltransferase [Clostridium acetobutyli
MNDYDNNSNINEDAWNKETYSAWVKRFGTPDTAAKKISKDPSKILSVLHEKLGDVKGKKIMNIMGSNGSKAVALALLGADVTVVDFSKGNMDYALDLAKEADVKIDYILSDILKLPEDKLTADYDIVFAEMGIIHYFIDLKPFIKTINRLLKEGGLFVLRDFHPVSTKLITSRGSTAKVRKHKVTGDYFDTSLEEKDAAFSKYLIDNKEPEKVLLRKWTLGEIVTSVAEGGFKIKKLDEEPNLSCDNFDKGIPKSFTLTSEKLS